MRAREAQGPFVVTIFTSSEPQQDNPVDVSVLVQERDSNDAILDGTVKLMLTPPAGSFAEPVEQLCGPLGTAGSDPNSERFTVEATRRQASNKLLYATPITLDAAGTWQLQVFIQRGGDAVVVACSLPVNPPPRKLIGLLPYFILPPLMVALFAVNQWLRRKSLEKLQSPLMQNDLTVPGHPNIFVVGDTATLKQNGKPLPGVAQVAIQQGRYFCCLERISGNRQLNGFDLRSPVHPHEI
jgi:hypothetical protein